MSRHYCNGSGTGVATPQGALGAPEHELVRMHEQLSSGAICPICGLEWVPFVGFRQ